MLNSRISIRYFTKIKFFKMESGAPKKDYELLGFESKSQMKKALNKEK